MGGVIYLAGRLLRSQRRAAVLMAVVVAGIGAVTLTLMAGVVRTATAADRYDAAQEDRYDVAMEQASREPLTDQVAALPAVEDVVTATFVFGGFVPEGGEPLDAIVFAGSPEALAAEVVEGRAADPTRPDEFVATRSFMEAAHAQVGDRFELIRISREAAAALGFDAFNEGPDLPSLDVTVVGVIGGPSDLQDEFPLGVFPSALLDDAPVGVGASESLVALADGANIRDLRAQLDELPEGDKFSLRPVEWVPSDLRDAADTQTRALAVIAAIAGLAGLIVVGQLAARQVRSSDGRRFALAAVGMTRSQIVGDALGRIGLPALAGGVAASGAAQLLSDQFPTGYIRRLEPEPGLRFEPGIHLVGPVVLAVGLMAWVGVALYVETRRPRRPRPGSLVDRVALRLGRAQPAMGLRFAFGRHGRDAGGISTPVTGLVALVAALVAAGTFATSLDDLVDDPARQGYTFDFSTGQGGGPVPQEVLDVIEADADVTAVAVLGNIGVTVGTTTVELTGIRPVRGDVEVVMLSGERPSGLGEVALGRNAAADLDVEEGDDLTVTAGSGEHVLRVTGLAVVPGVEGGEGIGEGGVVTAATFEQLDPDREFGFTVTAFSVRPEARNRATADRLSEATGVQVGRQDDSSVIVNLARVQSAPRLIAYLLGALVLISLVNLMVLTIRRRAREVAVLGALGADRRWVAGVVRWHAFAFVTAVAALAVPVGIALGRVVFGLLTRSIGTSDDTIVPWAGVVVAFGVLVLVAEVVGTFALARGRSGPTSRRLSVE